MPRDRFRREAPMITIASLGIPLDLFRDSPRVEAGHCDEGRSEGGEKAENSRRVRVPLR
jgi:hypothetical protein